MKNKTLVLIIGGILLAAAVLGIVFSLYFTGGTKVVVTVDGDVYGSYDLHKDQLIVIEPESKAWHNTLLIENGRADIIESDCENQICVHTPPLQEDVLGMIVCLPHSLTVTLSE